jgi:hypothetical protein
VAGSLLVVVIGALAYDNLVIASGIVVGEGDALFAANVGRYVFHALLTPLLIPVGLLLAGELGVGWARSRGVLIGGWALTGALVVMGVVLDVARLELRLEEAQGVVRYVHAHLGPPVPAILTNVVLLVTGGAALRRGTPWMLAGAVVMFVAAGAGMAVLWVGNLGELVLAGGLVATLVAVGRGADEPAVLPAPA